MGASAEIHRRGLFAEVHSAFWKEEPSFRQAPAKKSQRDQEPTRPENRCRVRDPAIADEEVQREGGQRGESPSGFRGRPDKGPCGPREPEGIAYI